MPTTSRGWQASQGKGRQWTREASDLRWLNLVQRPFPLASRARLPRWRIPRRERLVDWHQTARAWQRHGGDGMMVKFRKQRRMPPPLVVLWDVSGSMNAYADYILPWLYRIYRLLGPHRMGVFPFGTEIEDVSRLFRRPWVEVEQGFAQFPELWGAGTTIGECLHRWIARWGHRWLKPGLRVWIISDGWDRGEPDRLASGLATLVQCGAMMWWLNPLMATEGFEPKTRALVVARPWIEGWVPLGAVEQALAVGQYMY